MLRAFSERVKVAPGRARPKQNAGPLGTRRPLARRGVKCSGGRRRLGALGRPPALGHELIEFGLVLGLTQAFQEGEKIALLILETAQGLVTVLVEGVIAA